MAGLQRGDTVGDARRRLLILWLLCMAFLIQPFLTNGRGEALTAEDLQDYQEPTCVESGYRLIEEAGQIRFEIFPPTGHQFDEWVQDSEGKAQTHTCRICGYQETIRIDTLPANTLPVLSLKGELEGIGKKSRVVVDAAFTSMEQSFQCFGIMTLQGHSTFGYPKKNYTIRFFDDAAGTQKHKVRFQNWRKEHKFILKANYIDLSQCRNLVASNLWAEMVRTRNNAPERLTALPTCGAVDGFPAAVYFNDSFFGLYTINLHKDDDLYRLQKGEKEALLICNRQTSPEALFRAPAAFAEDYSNDWEIEFCGTEDYAWAKERFNALVSFVMNSTDGEFREMLSEYLDVDAAIDYLIFITSLGLQNSGAKDLVMVTFGETWIPSAFDMDEAFGLDAEQSAYRQPDAFLPALTREGWDSGTGSLLWDRLLTNYEQAIKARYAFLRNHALSTENMLQRVHAFIAAIPESFYDYDYYLYPERSLKDLHMEEQIRQYIPQRMSLLDQIWESEGF